MDKRHSKIESHKKAAVIFHEGKDKISDVFQAVKDKTEEITDQVKDTAFHLYKEGRHQVNAIEKTVKERPIPALLIAGSIVGYILYKLLKR
jgi:ElaB/YqjD/DUF883 family membrane-anchored ribosome-binding protein